jgi:Spy/CpxP family protein refolding chaperone
MTRTFKTVLLGLALLVPAGAFATPSSSGPTPGEHRGHHRGAFFFHKIQAHAAELGIAPATLDQMKAAFDAARPDFQRLHQQVRDARQSGDQAKIAAAEKAMQDRHQALRAQIEGMLTDQQKAAIKQMMERHRQEREQQKSAG